MEKGVKNEAIGQFAQASGIELIEAKRKKWRRTSRSFRFR